MKVVIVVMMRRELFTKVINKDPIKEKCQNGER